VKHPYAEDAYCSDFRLRRKDIIMLETQKNSFQKVWDVLQPFLIYYILHYMVFYLLAFLLQVSIEAFGQAYEDFMMAHAETVTGIVSGAAMLIGVLPMVGMLKKELAERAVGNVCGHSKGTETNMPGEAGTAGSHAVRTIIMTAVSAITSSLGLNVLLTITGFVEVSDTFQDVSGRQFGVAIGVGIILYGIVSPLAEEIVFRGLMYNRMRKYFPVWLAIVVSGLFFGLYHGNLVQGIYGSCMGILMAYLYEKAGKFYVPLLFHALANMAVYLIAYLPKGQEVLFTPLGCVGLLAVAAVSLVYIHKNSDK
jgi:membrane protease YdiL (CAAX protease family)